MSEAINLIAVLEEILDSEAEGAAEAGDSHPDEIRLYEYLQGLLPEAQSRETAAHTKDCERCGRMLDQLRGCIETARGIDVALPPKRAAAPGDVIRTVTRDKTFELTLRPNVRDASRGVLIVRAMRPELEGRRVVARDAAGKDLLRGRLVRGEASQRVENAEKIDLAKAVIVAV